MPDRVRLDETQRLTFYGDGALTKGRRTRPIPQLQCVGRACRLYQPDVVRCKNVGGHGTDVDWTCEADLPEALRFGRVEVQCEGYDRPGDPYVLRGSCSLEYRLVDVPSSLRTSDTPDYFGTSSWDLADILFAIIFLGVLAWLLYRLLDSCFDIFGNRAAGRRPGSGPGGPDHGSGSGFWSSGGNGNNGHDGAPPPPYSKYPQSSATNDPQPGWRPGFWTGAAMGGLANHLWNGRRQQQENQRTYDWERSRLSGYSSASPPPRSSMWRSSSSRLSSFNSYDDRGEGPSNLGAMRSSTGLGGTSVR